MRTITGPSATGSAPKGTAPLPRPLTIRLNGASARLATFCASRVFSAALVAGILLADLILLRRPWGFAVRALLDEPGHLATAMVALGTLTRWRGRPPRPSFTWAMLTASVAIDVDHLPGHFLHHRLLYGNLPRPYTHALWLLALLALIALGAGARARARGRPAGRPRAALTAAIFAGAACGLATHFLRDVATAPIALFWPISNAWIEVPYGWYLGLLILMLALPLPARRRRAGNGP